MKKHLFIMIVLLLNLAAIYAAPMFNVPIVVTQPNGQQLNCFVSGDEFNHRMHDKNGYTIVQDIKTAYYVYAELKDNRLVPTGLVFGKDTPSSRSKNISVPNHFFDNTRKNIDLSKAPTHGILSNIIVFLKFQGDSDISEPFSLFNGWLNDSTNTSLNGYYKDASYGALNVVSTAFPTPNNNQVVCFVDSHPREYYKPYSSINTIGYQDDNEGFQRLHACLNQALVFIENQVPADLNLDGDNDGVVDNVCFIAAGEAGDWADALWPHMWQLQTDSYIHGKKVLTYNFQLENFLYYSNVSVFCHEMFHSIGAPDLYHYNGDNYSAVGPWDLMENDNAQHMSAYMKYRYGNWISEVPAITQSGTYYLHPLKNNTNNAYKIYSPVAPNQYFIVEYRKQLGLYESNIPGNGLLVYRVNLDYLGKGNPEGLQGGLQNELILYRPYGSVGSSGIINQANLSLETGRTALGQNANAKPFLADDTYGGLEISQVGACGDSISFYVNISGTPSNYYPPRNLKAQVIPNYSILLTWDKPLNADSTVAYLVYRDDLTLALNTTVISDTFFVDTNVPLGENGPEHKYSVCAAYSDTTFSEASNIVTINVLHSTSIDDNTAVSPFVIKAIYPNPFVSNSTLELDVKNTHSLSVDVYNIKGQLVKNLRDNKLVNKGSLKLTWDGTDNNHKKLSSGVYFYRLKSDKQQMLKKVLLIK